MACRDGRGLPFGEGVIEPHPFEHLPCGPLICRGGVSPLLKRTGGGVKTPSLSDMGEMGVGMAWGGAALGYPVT